MRTVLLMSAAVGMAMIAGAASHAQIAGSAAGQRLADMPLDPYPSTYVARPAPVTAIVGATALTGTGATIANATVVMQDGKVAAVGAGIAVPPGAVVIDGTGKFVTPGIIDAHSHLGVGAVPSVEALADTNESTDPNTAEVWAEHSVWPQDPGFLRAIAGGVTSQQILVGSANLFGGRSVVLKSVWSRTVQGMKFPGAKHGLKMACGENPKRVYGGKNRSPSTSMANFAGYRAGWIKALEYQFEWDQFRAKQKQGDPAAKPPKIDMELETLAGALRGDILVQMHCYRGDEMAQVIDMAKEFGYRVTQFHHAVEAYKVRDLLAREGICASMWADWWGFKMESLDGIEENIALVHEAGGCAVVHSDSNVGIQRLNQEAAKALAAGRRMGLTISDGEAMAWITLNPAKSLGLADKTGSLEPAKMADVVIWNRNPMSVYALAEQVYVDGALTYDRARAEDRFLSDFELGQSDEEDVR
ncbi:MAG: amidohydrolase [Rhodospirillaceae bacterium]|nr:amidohydrolase [Rhodospirillaceae bacterium]